MKIVAITSRYLPGNLGGYCKEHNIDTVVLNTDQFSIASKWVLIRKLLIDCLKILRHLRTLKRNDVIISVGYITIPLLLFRGIGLLSRKTSMMWEGFFLHNDQYFPLFRKIFRLLYRAGDNLLVYSEYEKTLYSEAFDIAVDRIHFIPLVFEPEPNEKLYNQYTTEIDWNTIPDEYYFSGGYSHRDYVSLVEAFRNLKSKLVICSSKLNSELHDLDVPGNVILLNDVAREEFAELVRRSKACLLLIKSNSGAAGQLFAIEVMFYGKIIIASATSILMEMIVDRVNGFLVKEPLEDIPAIIREVEDGKTDFGFLGVSASEKVTTLNTKVNYNVHLDLALGRALEFHSRFSPQI